MIDAVLGSGAGNFGALGFPRDPLAMTALALGVLLAFEAPRRLVLRLSPRTFLLFSAIAAFLGSLVYVQVYLRGGPRIIDATSYYLEGAALSRGDLMWPVPLPAESFRGRFLLAPTESSLTGIFPIGYPLLLSLAFRANAPLLLGPFLAGGIVLATHRLARTLCMGLEAEPREAVARSAVLLSIASGTLRYHTADTMSHGLATLLATCAFTELFAVASASPGDGTSASATKSLAIASFCTSYLGITRFASAWPLALLLVMVLARDLRTKTTPKLPLVASVLAFPVLFGIVQLLVQRAQTGSFFSPAQSLYYRLSDGPEGCFRYGFGSGVGCMYEHGDFVKSQLPHGYGAFEALKTTGRRFLAHGGDAANVALFLPLAFAGLRLIERGRTLAVGYFVLHVLAYVPFYFDGNYPGGGARFFTELVPLEQVLVALGVFSLSKREVSVVLAPALSLVVFAVHGSFAHLALRDRDEGVPFFRPSVLEEAGVREGLVFVDTDHGFNLGHAHALRSGTDAKLVVARYRGDGFDRLLYDRIAPKQSYRYIRNGSAHALVPFVPPRADATHTLTLEAESFWPPREVSAGYALPEWPDFHGASGRVYTFYGGAPVVRLPEGADRYRLKTCASAEAGVAPRCRLGEWRTVPNDRRISLAADLSEGTAEARKANKYAACDAIEVSFPVAPGP
ncbi:MAG: hypothetical protein U0174_27955 [Polyangiaceae bacterium]